jgi:hypothetical protein
MIGEWWIGKDFKGSGSDIIEALSNNLFGSTEKKTAKKSVRIASVLAKIRTENLQNATLKRSAIPACSVLQLE